MSAPDLPVFQAGLALHRTGEWVRAKKRSFPVQLRFAENDCVVATLEGEVPAHAGDAIVTGSLGEQWPVSPLCFAARYVLADNGQYWTAPLEVMALQVHEPFAVQLTDSNARLSGQSGDWVIDYGDGSLGLVADAIFRVTYVLMGSQ